MSTLLACHLSLRSLKKRLKTDEQDIPHGRSHRRQYHRHLIRELVFNPDQDRFTFFGQSDATDPSIILILFAMSQSLVFQTSDDAGRAAFRNGCTSGDILHGTGTVSYTHLTLPTKRIV